MTDDECSYDFKIEEYKPVCRLVLVKNALMFEYKKDVTPNWWWRMWQYFLLGWYWEKCE